MFLTRGGGPHSNKSKRPLGYIVAAYFVVLLSLQQATAQVAPPLTLAEAEDLALRQEPGLSEFQARADALEEQAVAAGQLPDPVLRVGLANFPIESGGFSTEAMTQGQLGIRQAFPPGKTRSLSTQQFQSLATEMDRNADARARDVLTSVRSAWLDAYYWERAHAIVSDSRSYFDDLVTVTRSLYSVGKKDQQDVLRAELELSRLDDRLIDIERQRRTARAALSQWVGADSTRPIANKLPAWGHLPEQQTLIDELALHPALLAADAKIDARDAGVRLAEERYKPGWAVDLGYGYRDGSLPNGNPRSDFVSVSVTVDLPFFRKNRQDRKFSAALSERRAAAESKEALLRRLSSRLDAEFARWQELSRRIELYE
ncbi:MAG: TolC family protein, partial [Gammaproteobacteria bacterium]|nr:TolC family protein [Gammaproteobacteria bacterium]NNL51911.1 TolC family protein [Woeseiaceae bacterium]